MKLAAVHVIDALCYDRIVEHLAPGAYGRARSTGGGVCLSFMLHCDIALEPLLAAACGVRSYWLEAEACQLRLKVTASDKGDWSAMSDQSLLVSQWVNRIVEDGTFAYIRLGVPYDNMAATLTDAFLQAGLNYNTCVSPRIGTIRRVYPDVVTTSDFVRVLDRGEEFWQTIRWQGVTKRHRIQTAARFFQEADVQTEADLLDYLQAEREAVAGLPGVGPKTLDYFHMLCGDPTRVAVDTHMRDFPKQAGVRNAGLLPYAAAQTIVIDAAYELGVAPALLDHSIWDGRGWAGRYDPSPT